MVLKKTLKSPLDCKEIQPVHPKGNQSWIFIGRTGAETPTLWPPDAKNWPIWKDPDAGKDCRQGEKGTTEDKMVGWHHQCNGHESEQAPEVGDGQGSLACCSPWGCKESDRTEWLNWIELKNFSQFLVIYTVKGYGLVNKAEVDAFLEFSCFVNDPVDAANLISGSSAFSKSSLNLWGFQNHCRQWMQPRN